jgi:hypothetical protein
MKTYGKQKWTLEQIKAELVYKTTWGSSVVADLVAEVERLQGAPQMDVPIAKQEEVTTRKSSS